MKSGWVLLAATWVLIGVLLWRGRRKRRGFQKEMLGAIDAARDGLEQRHTTQMETIRRVWRRIEPSGESPEMLAELAQEEERHQQEVQSMRQTKDRISGRLGESGAKSQNVP